MITVEYQLVDFKGAQVDGNSLRFEVAATGRLPVLATTNVDGDDVFLVFDTDTRLTPAQLVTLDAVVVRADAAASYLKQQQDAMKGLVDEHAKTLRQSAEKTDAQVNATRDATGVAVDATTTPEAAVLVAEQYIGRTLG